jgi:hypothetical protein
MATRRAAACEIFSLRKPIIARIESDSQPEEGKRKKIVLF